MVFIGHNCKCYLACSGKGSSIPNAYGFLFEEPNPIMWQGGEHACCSIKAGKPKPHSWWAIGSVWSAFSINIFCLKFLLLFLVSMFYCYSALILDNTLVDSVFVKRKHLILLLFPSGGTTLKKQPVLSLSLLSPPHPVLDWLLAGYLERMYFAGLTQSQHNNCICSCRVCRVICEVSGGVGGLHVCDLNSVQEC